MASTASRIVPAHLLLPDRSERIVLGKQTFRYKRGRTIMHLPDPVFYNSDLMIGETAESFSLRTEPTVVLTTDPELYVERGDVAHGSKAIRTDSNDTTLLTVPKPAMEGMGFEPGTKNGGPDACGITISMSVDRRDIFIEFDDSFATPLEAPSQEDEEARAKVGGS